MLRYIFLILIYLPYHTGFSQTEIDSLKNELKQTNIDTIKVQIYNQFFNTNMFYDDPDAIIDYSYKALNLSETSGYLKGGITAHNHLGYVFRTRSESDSAFYHYNQAKSKAEKIGYYKGLTDAYIGLGNTFNQISQWNDAIIQFNRVIYLAKEEGDSIQVASAHNNIGNTFLSQSKFEDALENYQKALMLGDDSIKEVSSINVAVVHMQMENIDKAREYFENSLILAQNMNKKGHLAFIYKNLGVLEKKSTNYQKSIDYYNQALETYTSLSDDYNASEIIQNLGNVYYELDNYDEALNYYNRSLEIQEAIGHSTGACYNRLYKAMTYTKLNDFISAKSTIEEVENCANTLNLPNFKRDIAELMSKILAEQGNYREAYTYQLRFKTLSDSLNNVNSEAAIAELDEKYQSTQKEQEIELLSAENEVATLQLQRQQNLRNILIISALLLVLLMATLYSRYKIKVRANTKLKELDALKTNFFTNISHEFRTPLTLILNPIQKLLKSKDDDFSKEDLEVAYRNANHLLDLTNQILDLSKLEAGKVTLSVGNNNLNEFLKIVVSSFTSLADSRGIKFKKEIDLLNGSYYYDQEKLQKILNNLLSNAFKFTESGDTVTLKAFIDGPYLKIEVKDTGVGLSIEDQSRIFDRFHQSPNHPHIGGTGIGLTLTQELVHLHKGQLYVQSALNHGSTFKLEIPIDKGFYRKSELSNLTKTTSNKIINPKLPIGSVDDQIDLTDSAPLLLIVEDNPDLRQYIGSIFNESFRLIYASNGKQGINEAKKHLPDLIISDWMMPELSGQELCHVLKTSEKTSHIPIILLTAKADKESKIEGIETGADDYITKPFDTDELLVIVKNLIRQRENLKIKWGDNISLITSNIDISEPDKEFIKKAIGIVETNISNSEFTVEQFQNELGYSRSQLHRKLKALTDSSASEFIRDLRLEHASKMLSINGYQVSEVAFNCGFNSVSYFSQCFREKYGATPSNYIAK